MSTSGEVERRQGESPDLAADRAFADENDQLRRALVHRTVIGQAQGIVMARLDVDADQAIAYLKRASMHTNRKLIDIAEEIAATRDLIGLE